MQEKEQGLSTGQDLETNDERSDLANEENRNGQSSTNDPDEDLFTEDNSDEDLFTEEEEPSGAKYRVGNEGGPGGAFAAVGDHAQLVNINYIVHLAQDARHNSEEQGTHGNQEDDFQGNLYQLIGNALASAHRGTMFPVKISDGTRNQEEPEGEKALSQWNEEEIASWYYNLSGYEQCYVQAVAVLHGAPASEISKRADGLYVLFKMEREPVEAPTQQAIQAPSRNALQLPLPPSLHDRSSATLYQKTHTFTQRVEGVERLFWRDVDTYGQSVFGLRFLDFLAKELLSKGEHGKDFLDRLEQWSSEGQEECRLFSARALGIFLWRQDVAVLRQKAAKWARNRSLLSWRRTAMLLNGAYDIDRLNQKSEERPATSSVLALLQEWKERGQKLSETTVNSTDIYAKCAAANAYELIGKHFPEIAIQGLEQLLLSTPPEAKNAHLLLAAITSAYVSLSWSGHVPRILTYLAQMVEQALLQPGRLPTFRQRLMQQQQCVLKLKVSFNAFFFIVATSLPEEASIDPLLYEKPLPDPLVFPDPLGRDMILAGLCDQGAGSWFEQIVVLVAAAIMEKTREYRSPAFDLIQKWMQYFPQQTDNERESSPLSALRRFLLRLDATLDTWCRDLKKRGKVPSPARTVYRRQLQRWAKKKGKGSILVQEVLTWLDQSSSLQNEIPLR